MSFLPNLKRILRNGDALQPSGATQVGCVEVNQISLLLIDEVGDISKIDKDFLFALIECEFYKILFHNVEI